jgi:accessory gene regulator protein AgrB
MVDYSFFETVAYFKKHISNKNTISLLSSFVVPFFQWYFGPSDTSPGDLLLNGAQMRAPRRFIVILISQA